MTPAFAQEVDPILAYVLDLLERIDKQDDVDPADERARIRDEIARAEARLGKSREWQLAKYALVYWVDEVLCSANWAGAEWWINNVLEFELFGTHDRALLFFTDADDAKQPEVGRDALEVFYLCVLLGFRGIYLRAQESMFDEEKAKRGWPEKLEDWVTDIGRSIKANTRSGGSASGTVAGAAPPLAGQSMMLASMLTAAVLGAVLIVTTLLTTLRPY